MEQARHAAFDLTGDEGIVARQQKASMLSWDRKKKKFVQGDGAGSDNKKIIKTESGARLPATYRSGRFDEWKNKKRIALPRIGEAEGDMARSAEKTDSRKYRHNQTPEAKPLDRQSTTYEKKLYQQKKKAELGAKDLANGPPGGGGKSNARNKSELRDVSTIRKNRQIQEQVSSCSSDIAIQVELATDHSHDHLLYSSDEPKTHGQAKRVVKAVVENDLFESAHLNSDYDWSCDGPSRYTLLVLTTASCNTVNLVVTMTCDARDILFTGLRQRL